MHDSESCRPLSVFVVFVFWCSVILFGFPWFCLKGLVSSKEQGIFTLHWNSTRAFLVMLIGIYTLLSFLALTVNMICLSPLVAVKDGNRISTSFVYNNIFEEKFSYTIF